MKTFARVREECQHLSPIEVRAVLSHLDRMPEALAECDSHSALLLYLADVLRLDRMEMPVVLAVLGHFKGTLFQLDVDLGRAVRKPDAPVPLVRLAIFDGRYVTLTGEGTALDLETGVSVIPPTRELRVVSYNLTTLMALRWGAPKPQGTADVSGKDLPPGPAPGGRVG